MSDKSLGHKLERLFCHLCGVGADFECPENLRAKTENGITAVCTLSRSGQRPRFTIARSLSGG